MKKLCLVFTLVVLCLCLAVSCDDKQPPQNNNQDSVVKYTREYWGEWKKLDQSETWLINSNSIRVNGTASSREVVLTKPSENVISVTENGITYCLYAVRTASSSIKGNVSSSETPKGEPIYRVVAQNIRDANDKTETTTDSDGNFSMDNLIAGDDYRIQIGDTSLSVRPSYSGEDIGTITLMNGVNFKVTIDNPSEVMYAGSVYYSMNLIIENIGDTNCTAATYTLTGEPGLEVINHYTDGVLLRTVASGEKKIIPLRVKCSTPDSETVIKKLNLVITDRNGTTWNDSVSLKFYRDSATINVVSETGRPISGVIIGDGRTFLITGDTQYSVIVPKIADGHYLLVFSGAIANSTRNTETAYSLGVNCSAVSQNSLLKELGTKTNSFEPNNQETLAYDLREGNAIVSYLFENDIDYFHICFHVWDSGIVLNSPSCINDGVAIYSCECCGEMIQEELPATGHCWDSGSTILEPTQATEGVVRYSCFICGEKRDVFIPRNYYIGETGPAGGFVFYDCDADNKSGNSDGLVSTECGWRFLEAAPADLRVIAGQPSVDKTLVGYDSATQLFDYCGICWDYSLDFLFVNGTANYDGSDCTGVEIGRGNKNTAMLVEFMDTASPGTAFVRLTSPSCGMLSYYPYYPAKLCDCLEYEINGIVYNDWFLPSAEELTCLKKNLFDKGIGCLSTDASYWSSSEDATNPRWIWYRSFSSGGTSGAGTTSREHFYHIRPIRAF